MSRIGIKPIVYPESVRVEIENVTIQIAGPRGRIEWTHHPRVRLEHDRKQNTIRVTRCDESRLARALHGTTRTLVSNMVEGVTQGHERRLIVSGIGFRVNWHHEQLVFTVGLAHRIRKIPPSNVMVEIVEDRTVVVTGVDKQKVGQFAAELRAVRPVGVYWDEKNNCPIGIYYETEKLRRKPGKSQQMKK
ncbi:MAG: 50S ribosomal protein L6 [Gemmataceae bacterium]